MWYGTSSNFGKGMCKELVMKYTKFAVFCALISAESAHALNDYSNNSFMFVRPVFDSVGIQQSSWHDIVFRKQKHGAAFQIYPIYEQSYPNLNNPEYFLFYHKNQLTIQGGATSTFTTAGQPIVTNPVEGQMYVESFNRDILGQWVGIYTNNTTPPAGFSLNPSQRQGCVVLEISQDLHKVIQHGIFENWFLNVAVPVTWIESNLGIYGDSAALTAMNNPEFNFVRMDDTARTSVRLTQAAITLGTRYMGEPDTHVIATTGVIVPLVEQDTNEFLFQPVQGFNSHFGFDTNVIFQFPICQKHEYSKSKILFFFDVHNNFLARNHQLRTFDIRQKPFSRYMQLFDRKTNELIPAMNALTLRARVEPFMITNLATGFRLKHNDSFGEIGYELWAHGAERVTPEHKPEDHEDPCGVWYEERYGIAFINTQGQLAKVNGSGAVVALSPGDIGQTASNSTINYVASPDGQTVCCPSPVPNFVQKNVYLKIIDLDHLSCAAQPAITHRAYASVGFGGKGTNRDCFANFGLFIEAAQNNAAMCFWGGWFKAGMSF
jgi:hypothetical protein